MDKMIHIRTKGRKTIWDKVAHTENHRDHFSTISTYYNIATYH